MIAMLKNSLVTVGLGFASPGSAVRSYFGAATVQMSLMH